MFMQVIEGRATEPERVEAAFERWAAEIGPSAPGFLGATVGATDDGTVVALARFESEDAARASSSRPEQDRWWAETSRLFSGEVTFHDCRDVTLALDGPAPGAGFVQIVEGRVSDPGRLRALLDRMSPRLREHRPEILGMALALHDGDYTEAVYFRSEEEARQGERKEPPDDLRSWFDEERAITEDVRFLDLHRPWMT